MKRPYQLRPSARRIARERAQRLVDAVALRTQVPVAQIVGGRVPPARVRLRAACAWLIRHVDRLSYHEISVVLGWADHSTARHMVARGAALRADDWAIRLLTDHIMENDR